MPNTAGRSRGRQGARSGTSGAVGEHLSKITATVATALLVLGFTLVMTKAGRDIDAATQRFMLFYAGVFALIGLTASVGVGLLATDRIVMTPGHRVMAQAVHRAVSFGALAFLVIHIVTEILAQRVHVIDAVVPFLSPYRTFYIGLGTIASDLILLIIVTSIFRKRFTAHGKAWRWRAIHYASYAAFVLGVLHGLLGGRSAKPYVDWSYGAAIALTALALVVRFLAISLRPKESLSVPPSADRSSGGLGASPLRAAALSMAQAQLGGTVQVLPASMSAQGAIGRPGGSQPWAAQPYASDWTSPSGPVPALAAAPAYSGDPPTTPIRTPHSCRWVLPYTPRIRRGLRPALAARPGLPASGPDGRQPRYEPGYDGPPRFEGAPRKHVPQDDVSSYPYGAQSRQLPPGGPSAGLVPRADTGPMPRLASGPVPRPGAAPPLPGRAPTPVPCRASERAPCRGPRPVRCRALRPAPCRGSAAGRCLAMIPDPCPGSERARCLVLTLVRCRGRHRSDAAGRRLFRCLALVPGPCRAWERVRCRVPAQARRRVLTPVRYLVPHRSDASCRHRSDASCRHRSDASCRHRSDAAGRRRSDGWL